MVVRPSVVDGWDKARDHRRRGRELHRFEDMVPMREVRSGRIVVGCVEGMASAILGEDRVGYIAVVEDSSSRLVREDSKAAVVAGCKIEEGVDCRGSYARGDLRSNLD